MHTHTHTAMIKISCEDRLLNIENMTLTYGLV